MSKASALPEIPFTPEDVRQLCEQLRSGTVVVGGQALAFWVAAYGIQVEQAAISMDADVLGRREDVGIIAAGMHGLPKYQLRSAISALVGNIRVGRGQGDFISIDVVDGVFGLQTGTVARRGIEVSFGEFAVRIMHPLDVLESRAANYAGLPEKQTPEGLRQLQLALAVAGKFLEQARQEDTLIEAAEIIARIHTVYSGKAAIRNAGIDLRVPLDVLRNCGFTSERGKKFAAIRLPQLLEDGRTGETSASKPK